MEPPLVAVEVVVCALAFDLSNGVHDSSKAIAARVSTGAGRHRDGGHASWPELVHKSDLGGARPDEVSVVDARVRLQPRTRRHPYLRDLP